MFTPTQPRLKWLAAGFGAVSLFFAVPVTVTAEESSTHQVLLDQQSDELERAKQQAIQAWEEIRALNWEKAVTLLEQALPVLRQAWGSEYSSVKALEQLLKGAKLVQAGNFKEAEAAFEQAANLLKEAQEAGKTDNQTTSSIPQSPELEEAKRLNQQAIQLYKQGEYNKAIVLAERALEIREKALGENHPDVAESLNNLALLYSNQGRYSEAEPLYQRSLAILEKALGENHPLVANNLGNLAVLYSNQGRYSEDTVGESNLSVFQDEVQKEFLVKQWG